MNKKAQILVIDSQGGGLGRAIIEKIKKARLDATVMAIGTNAAATSAMLKAGCDEAATGENAVVYNASFADFIVGGIGIIGANAMLGEITPQMAAAVSSARGLKVLIPLNRCNIFVAGIGIGPDSASGLSERIDEAVLKIAKEIENQKRV